MTQTRPNPLCRLLQSRRERKEKEDNLTIVNNINPLLRTNGLRAPENSNQMEPARKLYRHHLL